MSLKQNYLLIPSLLFFFFFCLDHNWAEMHCVRFPKAGHATAGPLIWVRARNKGHALEHRLRCQRDDFGGGAVKRMWFCSVLRLLIWPRLLSLKFCRSFRRKKSGCTYKWVSLLWFRGFLSFAAIILQVIGIDLIKRHNSATAINLKQCAIDKC